MPAFDQPAYAEQTFRAIRELSTPVEGVAFQDCTFKDCHFSESVWRKCRFEGSTFQRCDLSLIKLPRTRFKETRFKDCRLVGVNWCDADWEERSLLSPQRVDFDSCLLDHDIFIGLDLKDTGFKNCRARGADFENADLTRADFHGAHLEKARFINCNLTEADFTRAAGYAINARHNTLHKTRFSLPEAVSLLHSLDIILED